MTQQSGRTRPARSSRQPSRSSLRQGRQRRAATRQSGAEGAVRPSAQRRQAQSKGRPSASAGLYQSLRELGILEPTSRRAQVGENLPKEESSSDISEQASALKPPFAKYDDMNVQEVLSRIEGLDAQGLAQMHDYEVAHKNRVTVVREIIARLQPSVEDDMTSESGGESKTYPENFSEGK